MIYTVRGKIETAQILLHNAGKLLPLISLRNQSKDAERLYGNIKFTSLATTEIYTCYFIF